MNQTINQTIEKTFQGLTYDQVINVTQNPVFIIIILIVWFVPLLTYLIIGSCVSGKDSSGKKLKPMISYANFWIAFFLWFFFQSALILLLIAFPFWIQLI